MSLNRKKNDLVHAEALWKQLLQNFNITVDSPRKTDGAGESETGGEDLVPEIEKEAIATYPESNSVPDLTLGLEGSLFGNGASLSSNGDAYELSLESVVGSVTGQSSFFAPDEKKAYVLYGVKAEGNTDWFKDTKAVKRALEGAGKAGTALGVCPTKATS